MRDLTGRKSIVFIIIFSMIFNSLIIISLNSSDTNDDDADINYLEQRDDIIEELPDFQFGATPVQTTRTSNRAGPDTDPVLEEISAGLWMNTWNFTNTSAYETESVILEDGNVELAMTNGTQVFDNPAEFLAGQFTNTELSPDNRLKLSELEISRYFFADTDNHRILEVDRVKNWKWQYGVNATNGTTPGYVNLSKSVEIMPNTNALVADTGNHILMEINISAGNTIEWSFGTVGVPGPGSNKLDMPSHVSRIDNDYALVTDTNNHRVFEIEIAQVKKGWTYGTGSVGTGDNRLDMPSSAIRLANGTTLIADRGNDRVILTGSSKTRLFQYGTPGLPGSGPNQLFSPGHAYPLSNGNFLVTDTGNHRVIEIGLSGIVYWVYGTAGIPGYGVNYLNSPERAYQLDSGNILIVDSGNHRVLEISYSKEWLWQFGVNQSAGFNSGRLNNPMDVWQKGGSYHLTGSYQSDVIDAGIPVFWKDFVFDVVLPVGCNLSFQFRAGSSTSPGDSTWTAWEGPYYNPASYSFTSSGRQYIQFKVDFQSIDPTKTATITSLTMKYEIYESSGSILLPEFQNNMVTQFKQFNADLDSNGQTVNYSYTIDSGFTWLPVPINNSLEDLDSSLGLIQFKIEIQTTDTIRTPLIRKIQMQFSRVGELIEIVISPTSLNISAGNFHVFSATGWNDLGESVEVTPEWTTNVGTMIGSVFTAHTVVGSGYVNASVDSISASCLVNVTAGNLDHIKVLPFEVNITAGTEQEFTALGYDIYGNPVEFNAAWTSTVGKMIENIFHAPFNEGDSIIMARNTSIIGIALVHIKFDISHPPPIIKDPIPNQVYPEDSPPWQVDLTQYEFDTEDTGIDLNWFATGINNDLFFLSGQYDQNDIITITPRPDAAGSTLITLWLEDSIGFTDSQNVWINLTPVNDKPKLKQIPNFELRKGEDYLFDFEPYVDDIDNPLSELSIYSFSTMGEQAISFEGFQATINYPEGFSSDHDIVTITVSDGTEFSEELFLINFTSNSPPRLKSEADFPKTAIFNEDTNFTFVNNILDYFEDPESTSLGFTFISDYISAELIDNHLDLTNKVENWYGTDLLIIRANDNLHSFVETFVKVSVRPVNDPPKIKDLPKITVHYGEPYQLDLTPYIYDIDNSTEELTVTTNDLANAYPDDKRQLSLIVNYSIAMVGFQIEVTIEASDGYTTTTKSQFVVVSDNVLPRLLKPFRPVQFYEDDELIDYFNLNDHFTRVNGQELTFDVINDTVRVDIKSNHNVDISAPLNWFGYEKIIFVASDSNDSVCYAVVDVWVIPVNDKPVITEIPQQIGEVSSSWVIDLRAFVDDPDNDFNDLNFKLEQTRGYAVLYGSSILFNYNYETTEALTVEVDDGVEMSSTSFVVEFISSYVEIPDEAKVEDRSFEMYAALFYILILIVTINGGGIAYFYIKYKGRFKLEDLFLIHANGNLISHVGVSERLYTDNEILSGMLTAIQDFIKDGFSEGTESSGDDWSLDHLKFGDRNIFIERGDYMYIAAVFKGEVGWKLRNELRDALKTIDIKYSHVLSKWSGRLDGLSEINRILEEKFTAFAHKESRVINRRGRQDENGKDIFILDMDGPSDSTSVESSNYHVIKRIVVQPESSKTAPASLPENDGNMSEETKESTPITEPSIIPSLIDPDEPIQPISDQSPDSISYHIAKKANIPRELTETEKKKLPGTKPVLKENTNIERRQ